MLPVPRAYTAPDRHPLHSQMTPGHRTVETKSGPGRWMGQASTNSTRVGRWMDRSCTFWMWGALYGRSRNNAKGRGPSSEPTHCPLYLRSYATPDLEVVNHAIVTVSLVEWLTRKEEVQFVNKVSVLNIKVVSDCYLQSVSSIDLNLKRADVLKCRRNVQYCPDDSHWLSAPRTVCVPSSWVDQT